MRESKLYFTLVALLIVLPIYPVQPVAAQQDPPRGDCCYQIWGAGSNLGWASALLNYTFERRRLVPADETIFQNLARAGQHVEAACRTCSRMNPAWLDYGNKQVYLATQVEQIRRRPEPVIRRQVAGNVLSTYQWSQPLRVQIFNGQKYAHDTCAEKYFRLGFLLGYAEQAFLIALERQEVGRGDYYPPLQDGQLKLRESLQVLNEYGNLEGCAGIAGLGLPTRINGLLRVDLHRLADASQQMVATWTSMQNLLLRVCDLGTAPWPGPGQGPTGGTGGGQGQPPQGQPRQNRIRYFTDPPPVLAPGPGGSIILRKELGGYRNYGVADGGADILYKDEIATWNFVLPASINPAAVQRAMFRVSLITDDHPSAPLGQYSLAVWTNGNPFTTEVGNAPHGTPYGSRFQNWVQREYPAAVGGRSYSVTLSNTSGISNWYAVDAIELHLWVR